jgi:hypothetical protein
MGAFTTEEARAFMKRYEEWKAHNWRIGSHWGLFSAIDGLEQRVGYQCGSHYRRLVEQGLLVDPAYGEDENGKLKQLYPITAGTEIDQVGQFEAVI